MQHSRITFHVSCCFLALSFILLAAQASAFDVVDIPDPNLKKALRKALALPDEIPITRQEMLRLKDFRVVSSDIKDLTGLELAMHLKILSLGGPSTISDLTPLTNLIELKNVSISRNQISDIRPLTGLINLTKLRLWGNKIQDIAPLANLTNLAGINLGSNKIENLEPLAELINLQTLDLSGNQVQDITPLANLTALTTLSLSNNQVTDLNPLASLTELTFLNLRKNRIADVNPLANLTTLESLSLDRNVITNITPLIGLKNLKKLRIADNPIYDFSPLLQLEGVELDIEIDLSQLDKLNVVVEVPDPKLRQAIRETLSLPDGEPLTQFQMLRLTSLRVISPELSDLTGLEYATNLEGLTLSTGSMALDLTPISNLISLKRLNLERNQISDIRPLSNSINLRELILWKNEIGDIAPLANLTNLTFLHLSENNITDITPLANLTTLIRLRLSYNQVTNVTPLAGLTELTHLNLRNNRISDLNPLTGLTELTSLNLRNNRISDFSPLANLVNLEELWIRDNFSIDISPLRGLNLIRFGYDEICDLPPYTLSATERIENRSFPSVFRVWTGLRGLEHKTADERASLHDLAFDAFGSRFEIGLEWLLTETESTSGLSTQVGGNLEQAQEARRIRRQLNPNSVNLISMPWYATGSINRFPSDSEFWLRDGNGKIVGHELSRWTEYQIDFFHPSYQDLLINRIVAVANCGLYDGIMFDGFNRNATGFVGRGYRSQSKEEIIAAMTSILSRVRARVRDDFLILVNANRSKLTAYTEYINGTFMETGYDYDLQYTHAGLAGIENTLLWSEKNLREPQINCLEGEGIGSEPPDSPANLQRMRLFTALSLTHSDGYVLYTMGASYYGGSGHAHIWYDFWDTDLGQPIGPKAQRYKDIPGLFIREFSNGWAVYNRSGKIQTISLTESATGVSSGKSGITHILPDLDGEMYLKGKNPADVNNDGQVNVLDLVQVANGFGKSTPDPNGDGVANILDLVFVTQQFSQ